MGCYINSTNERLYGALEAEFGTAASLTAQDRLSFRSLKLKEETIRAARRDKTGSRTRFAPHPEIRTENSFDLLCYFPGRDPSNPVDAMTNLVESALGGERKTVTGLVVSATSATPPGLTFAAPHGLSIGQGLRFGGQLRFVKEVPNALTVLLSAPFDNGIQAGSALGVSATLYPGEQPRPITLGNYWTPGAGLDRVLAGSVIDEVEISLNSDFHGARFRGITREVVSASSFMAGSTGLSQFPAEPIASDQATLLVPGHIGRLFLGGVEFYLLSLTFRLRNGVDARVREFGLNVTPCYSADLREVSVQFGLYASTKEAVAGLHSIARQRQETDLSIQLGNRAGQLAGIHIPRFIPEIPEIADAESRVVMSYPASLAYGVVNDELSIAFA